MEWVSGTCWLKDEVDSRQRTLLISKADLSFPEYSKVAAKSAKLIEKGLFCLSTVSSYRALTFIWYLHGSIFRDTREGYLRRKEESKANSFYEVYFHLLDRQDKLLNMTPRIVMTPHWCPHVRKHSCTLLKVSSVLENFHELLKFAGEGKNCFLLIFCICIHGYDL